MQGKEHTPVFQLVTFKPVQPCRKSYARTPDLQSEKCIMRLSLAENALVTNTDGDFLLIKKFQKGNHEFA